MKLKKAFNSIASVLLVVTMLMSLLPVGVFATEGEQNYDLRILTFEDADYKGGINFAGENNWSSLIDDSQYGGDLLYGGGMGYSTEEEAYKWHDEGNTELSSRLCQSYGAFAFWSGGHAISNYNTADIETYGDYQSQITVYKTDVEGLATTGGGHNGSDNFAVHYGYMDGSAYNMAEELPALSFADGKARVIDHMYINTTTYALNCCVNGNDLTASIGESDYVKVVATGYDGETVVGTVEKYIVNGPDEMILDWTKWDLSGLGEVTKVEFNMLGTSDNGYGFSQAAYFAYDDVAVRFEKETVDATEVTLDKTEATLKIDETVTLTATVAPDNATDKTVTWSSENEEIATVENGVVTAVSAGQTTITATAGEKSATCVITVESSEDDTQDYDLRILTFEDADYKGGINFAGENNWSSLIDDSQYGGDLLYGGGMGYSTEEEAYKWHDEGNTELSSRLCQSYGAFAFWSGGHAISNYNTADIETYGDYQSQITVYKADVEELATTGGGHNGSDNFAVHYGYMDGSAYNMAEELPALSFADGKARVIDHMYINTTTYALNCCVNGNDLTASIGESDYVKVVATGYDGETVVGTVEKYIVNGPDEMILDWTKWDLSALGAVTKVEFNMVGTSDNGYGFSQAAYFAYDDVAVRFEKEQNELPTLADGISATAVADVTAGTAYTVKLDDIFTDADGDILTYRVKINDESATNADANYSFTPDIGGEYVLVFTANDGKDSSTDTYTVTLNVTNPVVTYNTTVLIPEGIVPEFYITNGYNDDKIDVLGDALVSESGTISDGFVPYTVTVPENIGTISIRAKKNDINLGGMSILVSESSSVTFREVHIFIPTKANDIYVTTEQAKIEVADYDGNFATVGASGTDADGISYYTFFLAATGNEKLYTFYAKPLGDLTSVYASTQANNKAIFTGNSEVYDTQVELSYKNAFKLNVPADAEAKAFRQNKNYNVSELAPLEIQNESNGSKTYYFNVSSGSDSYSYRVSKEGKITKAGFISGTEKKVTWSDEDLSPNTHIDYDKTTLFGARGDDSLLLNVNGQNRLILAKDETFKLRVYRVWQVINSDTANIMIEPDFNYNILSGSDIISITPVTNGNGNAKNNWLNITATGEGTAILEIGYDALDIISGNLTTNNGLSEFTFGACDEARKGLVIVQTANAATDVDFGIKSETKWDAEFDTLYFTGEYTTLDFLPTVTEGAVSKVEFSNDNGKTWTKLDKKDDNYTARIISGNNILKVTKDDGTTSYQVVRGDKITYTVSNVTNPGENLSAGDVARVTFDGVHFPMGKMSGIYNPGYIYGHKLTYTLGEAQVQTAGSFQYNFPANAYLDVTIPEDAEIGDSFSLTDGYIYFNSMGSAPGEHRNITDEGVPADFHATSTYYSRSILPDITITLESNDVSGGDDENDDGDTDGGTVGGNTGTTTKPDDDDIDVSNLKFDISGSEIKCYVTVSFEDFGKRKSGESGVVYKNALGEIIEEVEVPFKSRDTIATITLRLLKALDIKASYTGSATSNFYLSSIGNFTLNGKHYSSFGEFDAGAASGWMIKHNNWFINMGASEFTVQDGDKVEWLYTCQLGADIGCDWSNPSAEITGINFKSNYGTLSPSFSEDVAEYTYSVSSSTKSICLEAKQANYWSKVTYKSGDKTYKAMEAIPVSDGTIITIESAFSEYAGDTPSDTDKITITIQKSSGGTSGGSASSTKDKEMKDDKELLNENESTQKPEFTEKTFTDIKKDDWHYESVKYVYENNLMQGTGNGFEPESKMTRAMLVTVLYRMANPEEKANNHNFADVLEGQWYSDAVAWAAENDIVSGVSENKFSPNEDITREQMALIIYRYAKIQGFDVTEASNLEGFNDAKDVSDWALDAIKWANSVTLVNGTSETTLSPKDTATRAQVAAILMRFCENIAK